MTPKSVFPVAFLLALVLSACPRPVLREFTNADTGGRGRNAIDALFDGAGGGAPESQDEERDVVEPDIVRQDGDLLYILNQYRGLTLVDLDTREILATAPTHGYPRDLYLVGNRAYVLVANAQEYEVEDGVVSAEVAARLYVVDVSNPAQPAILGQFTLEGDLVDSRLVGDILYAVCADYGYFWYDGVVSSKQQTGGSWVTSVDVSDPDDIKVADEITFGGQSRVIQATPTAIFSAAWDWQSDGSEITYIDISDPQGSMQPMDSVRVRGNVADRFKMDAYNGVLRVVSNAWADTRRTFITTIDLADPAALEVMAETELERASNETLFATRFDGDKAYIVTYFVVDPLFVVDLSDPYAPRVTGELEVPGWSTHIEPRGDRLVALGVDDTDGRKVCVSLFDVSGESPGLVDRVTFGDDWTYSSAYSDVKAFTVLDDLILVPFSTWSSTTYEAIEALQFVSWTPDDLAVRGKALTTSAVLRSLEYGDLCYALTGDALNALDASDLDDPQLVDVIPLAEYVADFLELTPGLGATVIQEGPNTAVVRVTGLPLKQSDDVRVEIGQLTAAFARGTRVVLVGEMDEMIDADAWEYRRYYRVGIVECAGEGAPFVVDTLTIDVEPYASWWWYGPFMDVRGKQFADIYYWWYPRYQEDRVFLLGDTLALRCVSDAYDEVVGNARPEQGLALVDLRLPGWMSTVGLGVRNISAVDQAGEKLYVSSSEPLADISPMDRPLVANYVAELSLDEPELGPRANVPGVFVQYVPETNVLLVRDDQWTAGGDMRTSLRSVDWDPSSGGVETLDEQAVPQWLYEVVPAVSRVYFTSYSDKGPVLYALDVADNGTLDLSTGQLLTTQWSAQLIGASPRSAYVSFSGAVGRYTFSAGTPALTEFLPVMGWPTGVTFGQSAAYIPLGYGGLVQMGD